MSLFGFGQPRLAQSMDARLLYAPFIAQMVMMVAGPPIPIQLIVDAALIVGVVSVAVHYRRRDGWRWQAPEGGGLLWALVQSVGAVGAVALMLAFAGFEIGLTNAHMVPWMVGAGLIAASQVLTAFKLMRYTKARYELDCRPPAEEVAPTPQGLVAPAEAFPWMWVGRVVYYGVAGAVWLVGMSWFYVTYRADPADPIYHLLQPVGRLDPFHPAVFVVFGTLGLIGVIFRRQLGVRIRGIDPEA